MPMLLAAGINSRASSSCLPGKVSNELRIPVTLPPGRAWLATRPKPTGSINDAATTGMVIDAFLTTSATLIEPATTTSGLSWTSSAASNGRRVRSPSA
jgi:hypothetical protein